MTIFSVQKQMLQRVAEALGAELRAQMTFVGGCTTGLLLTDEFSREQVRHTDDVDLIVHVMGYPAFATLQTNLGLCGFKITIPDQDEEFPVCAMKLDDLRVDFMPDDEQVLGFSNRWYKAALETSTLYQLANNVSINLVHPVYFIATKLEAYNGRGKGDALGSRDIEDILSLIDGRPELLDEVQAASATIRGYISAEISKLLEDANFEYAVSSQSGGSSDREALLFERLEMLAQG